MSLSLGKTVLWIFYVYTFTLSYTFYVCYFLAIELPSLKRSQVHVHCAMFIEGWMYFLASTYRVVSYFSFDYMSLIYVSTAGYFSKIIIKNFLVKIFKRYEYFAEFMFYRCKVMLLPDLNL